MEITYDKIADALYITLEKKAVFRTYQVNDDILIDLDKKGNPLGVEVLGASSRISKKALLDPTLNIKAIA